MISALILTKNEADSISRALNSLSWCDDIVVIDAASTDGTANLAAQHGARVLQPPPWGLEQPFGGDEAQYRNWAIHDVVYRHSWLLVIDADETLTPVAADAIHKAVACPDGNVAYRIQRRDFFQGTWLRYAQTTPRYIRLFRPDRVEYRRRIHPVMEVNGHVGQLEGFLDHEPFSKGISQWVSRHNTYSTLEACEIIALQNSQSVQSTITKDLLGLVKSSDLQKRRVHQKRLFYRLPARPLIKFLLLYGLKGGFRDGRAGLTYAILSAIYEYLIIIKVQESNGHPDTRY